MSVQLPGRGSRYREKAYTDVRALVRDLAPVVHEYSDCPVGLFGHSMGALIAYEIAKKMTADGTPPAALFVSGSAAPRYQHEDPATSELPVAALVERLRRLNGVPEQVFDNQELLDLVLPSIRADFHLTGTYEDNGSITLTCPVIAFCGDDDPEVTPEAVMDWRTVTDGDFSFHTFPGDHFFLNTVGREMVAIMSDSVFGQVNS